MRHLKKLTDYRKSFLTALRGGKKYGPITQPQREFLIRELRNIQNVFEQITKS